MIRLNQVSSRATTGDLYVGMRINGGFFIFDRSIFDYIHDGEELVREPFERLMGEKELVAYKHEGFWACMDTFKEKQRLIRQGPDDSITAAMLFRAGP